MSNNDDDRNNSEKWLGLVCKCQPAVPLKMHFRRAACSNMYPSIFHIQVKNIQLHYFWVDALFSSWRAPTSGLCFSVARALCRPAHNKRPVDWGGKKHKTKQISTWDAMQHRQYGTLEEANSRWRNRKMLHSLRQSRRHIHADEWKRERHFRWTYFEKQVNINVDTYYK